MKLIIFSLFVQIGYYIYSTTGFATIPTPFSTTGVANLLSFPTLLMLAILLTSFIVLIFLLLPTIPLLTCLAISSVASFLVFIFRAFVIAFFIASIELSGKKVHTAYTGSFTFNIFSFHLRP